MRRVPILVSVSLISLALSLSHPTPAWAESSDYSDNLPAEGSPGEDVREEYPWSPSCSGGSTSGYTSGSGYGYGGAGGGSSGGLSGGGSPQVCLNQDPRKLEVWNKYSLDLKVGLYRVGGVRGNSAFEILNNICGVRPGQGPGVPGCAGMTGAGGCTKGNFSKVFSSPSLAAVPSRDDSKSPPWYFAGGVTGSLDGSGVEVEEYPSFYPTAPKGKETVPARMEMLIQKLTPSQMQLFPPDTQQFINAYFNFIYRHELRHVKVGIRFAGLFLHLDNVEPIEEDGAILGLTKTVVHPGAPEGRWSTSAAAGNAARDKWKADYKKLFQALRATEAMVHTVEEPHWEIIPINLPDGSVVSCPFISDPQVENQIEHELDIDDLTLPPVQPLSKPWF